MPDQGLSRNWSQTLRKGWEFDIVFRTGFRVQGELVRLLVLPAPDSAMRKGVARVGYAVGKRQGKAHVRARGRRVLREAFRRLAPWVVPGVALVLTLRGKGLGAKATDIYEDMARLLRRRELLLPEWRPLDVKGAGWNAPVAR